MAGDPPLIIPAVRPSGYDIAGELIVEAYRTLGDARTSSTSENCVTSPGGEALVAEVGGRVVGCVTFVDGLKALSEVDDPGAATVRMLGVATEARVEVSERH